MHPFYIPQCSIQNRNVHISVLNGALWDLEQVHSGICEIGLLYTKFALGCGLLWFAVVWHWSITLFHDDVIIWKHFPRYWPFMRGSHRSPVKSPHKGPEWRGALMFSLICAWINRWVNNGEAGDFRRYRAHHDAIVMSLRPSLTV